MDKDLIKRKIFERTIKDGLQQMIDEVCVEIHKHVSENHVENDAQQELVDETVGSIQASLKATVRTINLKEMSDELFED